MKTLLAIVFGLILVAPVAFAKGGGGGGHAVGGFYIVGSSQNAFPHADTCSCGDIHKIGIISTIGTTFWSQGLGKNPPHVPDMAHWEIDKLVGDTLRKYLGSKYELVDVTFDRASFLAMPQYHWREKNTRAWVKTLSNPGVDAYIIVRDAATELPRIPGIGIDVRARYGAPHETDAVLWTNFEIDIIDARRDVYLGSAYAGIEEQEGQPPQFASRTLPFPAYFAAIGFDPAHWEIVHREVEDLVPRAIVESIRSLQMGVDLPPVGDHSVSDPAIAKNMNGIRSVAVASAVGDAFQFVNPGGLFVTKVDFDTPLDQYKLDDTIESIAKVVLARHYVVKDVPYDRAALARMSAIPHMQIPHMLGLTPTNDVDAYVVIVKAKYEGFPYHGLGMWRFSTLWGSKYAIFANYAVAVVNARTLTSMGGSLGVEPVKPVCAAPLQKFGGGIECVTDETLWPQSAATVSQDALAKSNQILTNIFTASLPETLFHLGLDESVTVSADHPPLLPSQRSGDSL